MLKRLHAKKQNEEMLPRKRKEQFTEKFRACKRLNLPQPEAMMIRRAPESSLRAELYRRQRAGVFDRPIDKSLLGLLLSCKKIPNSHADRCFYGTNGLASEKQFLRHELKQEKS